MNTQFILISVIAFIAGIAVRSIFKEKPGIKNTTVKTENVTVKTEDVRDNTEKATVKTQRKTFLLSEIWDFVRGKLSEQQEAEIIKASKTDMYLAIRIAKMVGVHNNIHRNIHRKIKQFNRGD